MRASREYRKWVNRLRRRLGKTNGVIPGFAFDYPRMERLMATSHKKRDR